MPIHKLLAMALGAVLPLSVVAFVTMTPAVADSPDGGTFVPVTPTRVYTGSGANMATPAAPKSLKVLGVAGIPSSGVSAVVVDVAAQSTTGATNVYVRPTATSAGSSMLTVGGDNSWRSNTAIVRPSSTGHIAVVTNDQAISFNVDVQGYFTTTSVDGDAGGFVPITPARLVRTDTGQGIRVGKLQAQTTYTSQIGGLADVPDDAIAVFANVRLWGAANDSMFKVGASGSNVPAQAKSVDYEAGRYTDSGLTIRLGTGTKKGKIDYWLNSGSADMQIDVQGYFTAAGEDGGGFTPMTPSHFYDSRADGGKLAAGEQREIQVTGVAGIPDDGTVGSVAMSITAMAWTTSGVAAVWNADLPSANGTSNLGFSLPATAPVQSTSIVEVSVNGTVMIKNLASGPVHILIASQGWFSVGPDEVILPDEDTSESAWTPEECLAAAQADGMDYWFCTGDEVVEVSPEIEPAPEPEADPASGMDEGGENAEAPPNFAAPPASAPGSPALPAFGPLWCKADEAICRKDRTPFIADTAANASYGESGRIRGTFRLSGRTNLNGHQAQFKSWWQWLSGPEIAFREAKYCLVNKNKPTDLIDCRYVDNGNGKFNVSTNDWTDEGPLLGMDRVSKRGTYYGIIYYDFAAGGRLWPGFKRLKLNEFKCPTRKAVTYCTQY